MTEGDGTMDVRREWSVPVLAPEVASPEPRPHLVKLVRDAIPERLGQPGTLRYFAVGRTTAIRLLKRKLIEEAAEYLDDPSVEELADVLAVVEALARRDHGIGLDGLWKRAEAKRRVRGGFDDGICMYAEHPLDGQGRLEP